MPMPDERDITKQQLWERMDELHSSAISIIDGFNTLINSMQDVVARNVTTTLSEQKIIWGKLQEAILADNNVKQLDLDKRLELGLKDISAKIDQRQNDLDVLLKSFIQSIEQFVQKTQTDTIITLNTKINDLIISIHEYKKSTDDQMAKYQQEMAIKLGDITRIELDMKAKFKKISDQLSA